MAELASQVFRAGSKVGVEFVRLALHCAGSADGPHPQREELKPRHGLPIHRHLGWRSAADEGPSALRAGSQNHVRENVPTGE